MLKWILESAILLAAMCAMVIPAASAEGTGSATPFDPLTINGMKMTNRFFRAAIIDGVRNGVITSAIINKYKALADGGFAAIVTGYTTVDRRESSLPVPTLYNDSQISTHKGLVDAVHASDVKILVQLAYATSWGEKRVADKLDLLGPSAVTHNVQGLTTREMTLGEIKEVQKYFADAAIRAKKAGYDGLEIHGAHHFLLSQFLTPYFNKRTDNYGGTVENRARMLIETYEAVRNAVGKEYPIWIKINIEDFLDEGGITFDDSLLVCKMLAERGVDALEVSASWYNLASKPDADMDKVYEEYRKLAVKVAAEVNVPVLLTGGNREYKQIKEMMNSSNIVAFGLATPTLREPGIINRYKRESASE